MRERIAAFAAPTPGRLGSLIAIVGITAVAVLLRVCNLGSFSLWMDEVFTMTVAALPLGETLAACAADAENVPLYAVAANIGLRLGLVEPWIRLLPIAAGLGSIVLLGVWTTRHFDRSTALLTAAFAALAPFHVRYSQELRAYPYLLLVCTLTLVVADRLRKRPDWRSTFALAATVAAGCYTNLTYVLILVPVAGLILLPAEPISGADPVDPKRVRTRFVLGVALGGVAFLPWIWLISRVLVDRVARNRITEWSLEALGQRWQALTIAARDFERLSWFGALLAGLAVIGLVVAIGKPIGRAVLLPAVATVVAWELFLVTVDHWSMARYDTALWPFLAVLVALGLQRLLRWLGRRWLQAAAGAAVVLMLLVHVDAYHRRGRPHWDLVARAVEELRRPTEAVLTMDHWARICLSYYLGEELPTIAERSDRLAAMLERTPSLLLVSRHLVTGRILNAAQRHAELGRVDRTAALYRVQSAAATQAGGASETPEQPGSWPEPFVERVPEGLEVAPTGCLGRVFGEAQRLETKTVQRLEFDGRSGPLMRSGWVRFTTAGKDTTAAWALGREASVDLYRSERTAARIRIRLWPHPEVADSQRMRLLLNGHPLGERRLERGQQQLRFAAPPRSWRVGRNLLVLQFSELCCTAAAGNDRPAGRPRAAAVDWIEVSRHQPGGG